MQKWIVGVDEVGRGPLAGPLAVGAVCVAYDFDWDLIIGVGDSKQVAPKNREAIFRRAKELEKEGLLRYFVSMSSATAIDKLGLATALKRAQNRAIYKVAREPRDTLVKLDGSLYAPAEFIYQETIIKGDRKEKVIGLASIIAKVTRDQFMVRLARKPNLQPYEFSIHKGYGTKKHREVILKLGLSDIHRRSFCRGLLV